ncbi:MAG: YraN family protein [Oscillospiraceae bacterium]|nr:YraN family protein [Oscillospiraceae bacterium]
MNGNEISAARGKAGEDAVCGYLEEHGCRILARNYRKKGGEIDIIAQEVDTIVFVEVKTRKYGAMDSGTSAMTKAKMRRIIATSEEYMYEHKELDLYRRFDTAYVTVTPEKYPQVLDIEYYKADFNALSLE